MTEKSIFYATAFYVNAFLQSHRSSPEFYCFLVSKLKLIEMNTESEPTAANQPLVRVEIPRILRVLAAAGYSLVDIDRHPPRTQQVLRSAAGLNDAIADQPPRVEIPRIKRVLIAAGFSAERMHREPPHIQRMLAAAGFCATDDSDASPTTSSTDTDAPSNVADTSSSSFNSIGVEHATDTSGEQSMVRMSSSTNDDSQASLIERRAEQRLRQIARPLLWPPTSEDSAFSGSEAADGDALQPAIQARMQNRLENQRQMMQQLGGGSDEEW